MQAQTLAHRNRHYKTLILLVICMTVGAFFLFWLGQVTPVTPLRGKLAYNGWNKITVRTAQNDAVENGFFHYRIDESGQLYQTSAWKTGEQDPRHKGSVQILLTQAEEGRGISSAQEKSLARLISELRAKYSIKAEQIRLDRGETVAAMPDDDAPSRVGL